MTRIDVEAYMAENVAQGPPDKCWEWLGSRNRLGYGNAVLDGKSYTAHRAVWVLHNGPVRDAMQVCHTCDNPPCCNPSHLFLGTARDNARDAQRKGRRRQTNRKPRSVIRTHGPGAYANYYCRCDVCTSANTERQRRYQRRRREQLVAQERKAAK